MQGRRSSSAVQYDEMMEEIKKGPWKEEEDRVLINHVRKYGPRDWSSIRSKGLLLRTGKSCRLRWVNKLRPDLKTGVKFSAEEERTVIDLQAQFGNKWARIATYLTGRTDNDVKNFWSSRQKRLSRILHTTSASAAPPSSSTNSHNNNTNQLHSPDFHHIPSFTEPNFTSPPKQESTAKLSSQSCSSLHVINNPDSIKMAPFPELMYPNSLIYEQNTLQFDYTPQIEYPKFLDEFECSSGSAWGPTEQPITPSFFEHGRNCQIAPRPESNGEVDINFMIDDLPPIDMFDPIEPLLSPSKWS